MDGTNVRRTNHDLTQAVAMRSSRSNPSNSRRRKVDTSVATADIINEDDIRLGLEGLERASKYQKSGKLAASLRLYELSIELLLKYLKSERSNNISDGMASRDQCKMIEQVVHRALGDAEALKATIKRQNSTSPESIETSTSFRSLTDAIATALRGQKSTSPQNSVASRLSTTSTVASAPVRPVGRPNAAVAAPARSAVPDSAADQLYDTILSEFYVDTTRIQATKWSEIAGLEACQQALQEAAVLPLLRPDLCTGLRRPQNVLLYGPPGTGKTLLVRAVSHESQSNLFVCTASALTSKWIGESEKLVRKLFLVARDMVPSIIFMDEIDALLGSRKSDNEHESSRRFKTEFMVQVDGITKPDDQCSKKGHLLLVACTNCPWDVDSAVMRRFPRRIFVPLPDEQSRRALIASLLKKMDKHAVTTRQITTLVGQTHGYTCSDITAIASEVSFGPLRSLGGMNAIQKCKKSDLRPVQMQDFEAVLATASKSVTEDQLQRYDDWQKQQQ